MKSVVLLSGGIDSSVLLGRVRNEIGGYIDAITVDYGQRHRREMWSAFQIAHFYGAGHHVLSVPTEWLAGSSLTGGNGSVVGGDTVVPGRNLMFLSMAMSHTVRHGAKDIYLGANADDAEIYPDCRSSFVHHMNAATYLAYGVRIHAPFVGMGKPAIVELGKKYATPFDMTWSCYDPQEYTPYAPASGKPCGKCGACIERAKCGL